MGYLRIVLSSAAVVAVLAAGAFGFAEYELHRPPTVATLLSFSLPIETVATQPAHSHRVLYVIVDPECVYCRKMYREINQMASQNGVTVRYLLVAQEKRDSSWVARTILASANRQQAFSDWFGRDAIQPVAAAELNKEAVNHSLAVDAFLLMHITGKHGGTPLLLYADQAGKPHAIDGEPPDLGQLISSVGPDEPVLALRVP